MNSPRILITRTRQQASALAAQLDAIGAKVVLIPTIEVVAPMSFAALDAAIAGLSHESTEFDWLIFTSANAVHAMAKRARKQGIELHPKRVAAIGPATATAIKEAGIAPQYGAVHLPSSFVAESLAESLLAQNTEKSQHYLLARAEEARDIIPAALEDAGHRVTIAAAYRNITPPNTLPALKNIFSQQSEWPDVITFTSSSTARNLIELLDSIGQAIPPGIALVSIGPITSATLREFGYEPALEAQEPTVDSFIAAIANHLKLR